MSRHRAPEGQLLSEDDPRVVAAMRCFPFSQSVDKRLIGWEWDWRDVAEIVNAVLEADDRMVE